MTLDIYSFVVLVKKYKYSQATNIIEHILNVGQGRTVQKEKAVSGFWEKPVLVEKSPPLEPDLGGNREEIT